MRVTFPHMGTLWIPVRTLLTELGADCVVPPPTTNATVARGAAIAPESACLPLKIGIGNFLEAEELGAEAVVMAGGTGPCRLGYYAEVQRGLLQAAGSQLEFVVLEPPRGHISPLWQQFKRIGRGVTPLKFLRAFEITWAKLKAVDELDRLTSYHRAHVAEPGGITALQSRYLRAIDQAGSIRAVRALRREQREQCQSLPRRTDERRLVRCGLIGEVYMVLEPALNHDVERRLGELGVEVERSIFITDWVKNHLGRDTLRLGLEPTLFRWAKPYLGHWVGGHGTESVGSTVRFAHEGFDGVVQIAPLTCMPEIVAHSILHGQVSRQEEIPVLTLYFDEHAGEAGTVTRLEAFADLMRRRRETRSKRA